MRIFAALLIACLLIGHDLAAQPDPGFSGSWKLNPARSDIRPMPVPPEPLLKVEESVGTLTVAGQSSTARYPLDGRSEKHRVGNSTMNTATKWEGAALLVNTLVSGPQNYTVMERWKRSRDGNTLTIKRTIVSLGGETESVLVYESSSIPTLSPPRQTEREATLQPVIQPVIVAAIQPATPSAPQAAEPSAEYTVDAGTRVLLRLTNSVNTKHTAAGDRVYLETVVPVFVNGHLVIPRGSNVTGTITESQRAGRVKGKSALNLRFESITLPNGLTRNFRSRASSVGAAGDLDHSEGKIHGEGNKGGDARTVGETTAAGAGIGTIAGGAAGHYGMGAGIGAAAGAAAGLARVLGSRGADVVLAPGTTIELTLDRDLRFSAAELRLGVQ